MPKEEQADIMMEMNSYIYEGMRNSDKTNELEHLQDIIHNFGDLDIVLKPIVAERKLEQATKTFNPSHVFKALVLNFQNGVFFIFISVCYLALGWLGVAMLAKIISPNEIGMFYKPGEYFVLAGIPGDIENQLEYELLGNWYIPFMMLGIFVFYLLITLILRFERYLKKKGENNWQEQNLSTHLL